MKKQQRPYKYLFISDIHGLREWKDAAREAVANGDYVIFLGDYVDSFHIPPGDILENLNKIVNFKKQHPDQVTLLIGNHDYAYMYGKTNISGFRSTMWESYRHVFSNNWDLFQVAWGHTSDKRFNAEGKPRYTLVTHAGLSHRYWEYLLGEIEDQRNKKPEERSSLYHLMEGVDMKTTPLHEILNLLKDQTLVLWKVGYDRGGYGCGSLLWADYHELITDAYPGIDQIIGHTGIHSTELHLGEDGSQLWFIDVYLNKHINSLYLEL